MKNQYVVYDARYRTEEQYDASIVLVTTDLKEAKETVKNEWNGGVIVEYEVDKDGKTLINPKNLN